MSALLNMFLGTSKQRVVEARQIPNQLVNFVDRTNEFSDNFSSFLKRSDGTKFTTKAIEYYDHELTELSPPGDFNQLEPDIPLNRWSYKSKYFSPGQANS